MSESLLAPAVPVSPENALQGVPNGFVVKDDIEQGYGNVLPLWQLGLAY